MRKGIFLEGHSMVNNFCKANQKCFGPWASDGSEWESLDKKRLA